MVILPSLFVFWTGSYMTYVFLIVFVLGLIYNLIRR